MANELVYSPVIEKVVEEIVEEDSVNILRSIVDKGV